MNNVLFVNTTIVFFFENLFIVYIYKGKICLLRSVRMVKKFDNGCLSEFFTAYFTLFHIRKKVPRTRIYMFETILCY